MTAMKHVCTTGQAERYSRQARIMIRCATASAQTHLFALCQIAIVCCFVQLCVCWHAASCSAAPPLHSTRTATARFCTLCLNQGTKIDLPCPLLLSG